MKKAIFPLVTVALTVALTACGAKQTGVNNAAYRAERAARRDGQYYAGDDGAVYDARRSDRAGIKNDFRDLADDAADGVRRAGDALGDAMEEMA